ncbi:hypothetical protein DAI22_01g370500 [Oryza sativa Japonica Group]|nr:hypothetical protein DAI22_01g370500 [Oryza sativa Japonica Group]
MEEELEEVPLPLPNMYSHSKPIIRLCGLVAVAPAPRAPCSLAKCYFVTAK